jgi:hypothetical protein
LWLYFKDSLGNETEKESGIGVACVEGTTNEIHTYDATVNTAGTSIYVTWTNPTDPPDPPEGFDHIEASYRINGGASVPVTLAATATSFAIATAPITTSGVLSGTAVGNVNEYEITLESHSITDKKWQTFKVWNIPGMSVNQDNLAVEISTQAELAAISAETSAGKTYVLTADIPLSGTWTPIGSTSSFQGKFYGNGRTISNVNAAGGTTYYRGLFGYTNNAIIRDLTVTHTTNITTAATIFAGGLVGYAAGNTALGNIITRGSFEVTNNSTNSTDATRCGGLAGFMDGTARIENIYSDLDVSVTANMDPTAEAHTGGIAGLINNAAQSAETEVIKNGVITGTIHLKRTTAGNQFIGGIAGGNNSNGKIVNVTVRGTLTMERTAAAAGINAVGGMIGYHRYINLEGCHFEGSLVIPWDHEGSGENDVGGISGYIEASSTSGSVSIKNTTAKGSISYNCQSTGILYLGGISGRVSGASGFPVTIDNCSYTAGSIIVNDPASGSEVYVGGFVGLVNQYAVITNSHSAAAEVRAAKTNSNAGILYVGGFIGSLTQTNLSGCYASSYVNIPNTQSGSGACYIGGFVGNLGTANVENCYATGNVDSYGLYEQYIGGLVGNSVGTLGALNEINRCYATGALTAESRYASTLIYYFSVGGLVGYASYTSINESYATGAVHASKGASTDGSINAGGLVGFVGNSSCIRNSWAGGAVLAANRFSSTSGDGRAGGLIGLIYSNGDGNNIVVEYCYSRSSVIARSNALYFSGGLVSGGLVGMLYFGSAGTKTISINHSVYLGPSVSAASSYSGDSNIVARIHASVRYPSYGTLTLSGNYASTASKLYLDTSYTTTPTTEITSITPVGDNTSNGAGKTPAELKTQSGWNDLQFYTSGAWLFTYVSSLGCPILRDVVNWEKQRDAP